MGDEFRAQPEALVRLAKTTLAGSDGMTGAWSAAQAVPVPPGPAFGNSGQGPGCATAAADADAAVDDTWRQLAAVFEGDVDRLYRVAFAYLQSDQEAADRQRAKGAGRNGPLL